MLLIACWLASIDRLRRNNSACVHCPFFLSWYSNAMTRKSPARLAFVKSCTQHLCAFFFHCGGAAAVLIRRWILRLCFRETLPHSGHHPKPASISQCPHGSILGQANLPERLVSKRLVRKEGRTREPLYRLARLGKVSSHLGPYLKGLFSLTCLRSLSLFPPDTGLGRPWNRYATGFLLAL